MKSPLVAVSSSECHSDGFSRSVRPSGGIWNRLRLSERSASLLVRHQRSDCQPYPSKIETTAHPFECGLGRKYIQIKLMGKIHTAARFVSNP